MNNHHWSICKKCTGQGKIPQGPSKRLRRKYRRDIKLFKTSGEQGITPTEPRAHIDICQNCNGSGLIESEIITPVNPNYPHIAIIGGGIGGTALAVACLHRGIPFTLYERDTSFDARTQGYGLTLQQASKAIRGLGITELKDGIISTRHVVHNQNGSIIGEWGLRKWRGNDVPENSKRKNIHISRQSLRQQLLHQLHDSESIKWGHKFVDFSDNKNGGYDINFEVNGEMITKSADLIVGADGIRSSVRRQLIPDDTPLQYLGCIVVLGICPLESLQGIETDLLDSATVFQTVNGHERVYMMPYDINHIMWQFSVPMNEQEAIDLHNQGSTGLKKEVISRLQDWHNSISEIIHHTDESDITGYPVYDREVLDQKSLEGSGNITIIGDAAHPMSPFKGQGANQAILDALYLTRAISIYYESNSHSKKTALRTAFLNEFENEMINRTQSKVQDSRHAVNLLHSDAVLGNTDEPRGRGINHK